MTGALGYTKLCTARIQSCAEVMIQTARCFLPGMLELLLIFLGIRFVSSHRHSSRLHAVTLSQSTHMYRDRLIRMCSSTAVLVLQVIRWADNRFPLHDLHISRRIYQASPILYDPPQLVLPGETRTIRMIQHAFPGFDMYSMIGRSCTTSRNGRI